MRDPYRPRPNTLSHLGVSHISQSMAPLDLAFPLNCCDYQSAGWCHHCHVSPCEWWHMVPENGPMGPLKCRKSVTCVHPTCQHPYCHVIADMSCHVSFENQSHVATWPPGWERRRSVWPCFFMVFLCIWFSRPLDDAPLYRTIGGFAGFLRWNPADTPIVDRRCHVEEREGGGPTLVLLDFSFVICFLASPTMLHKNRKSMVCSALKFQNWWYVALRDCYDTGSPRCGIVARGGERMGVGHSCFISHFLR